MLLQRGRTSLGNTPPAPPPHPSLILKLQGRGSQESYSSPQELWQRVSGDKEAAWYAPAVAHWDAQPATYDGVLAGLGHLNSCDIAESRTFLRKAFAKQLDAAAAGNRRLVGLGTPACTGPSPAPHCVIRPRLPGLPHANNARSTLLSQCCLAGSPADTQQAVPRAGRAGRLSRPRPWDAELWRQAAATIAAPRHGS